MVSSNDSSRSVVAREVVNQLTTLPHPTAAWEERNASH
jgi:hypothetical protein